jgi:hypothetical protein
MAGASDPRAANGAYAVDAADISEVGSCKVESWLSTAGKLAAFDQAFGQQTTPTKMTGRETLKWLTL